jgi:putative heme-binding domain-containing protein
MAWNALVASIKAGKNEELQSRARELSVVFGVSGAIEELRKIALDNNASIATRSNSLQTLIARRIPDLRQLCEQLLTARQMTSVAVRGLALFEDQGIGKMLSTNYLNFDVSARRAVIETLVSRPIFAHCLIDEIAANRIPRSDLTAFHVRQVRSLKDGALTKRLTEVWGELHDTSAEKRKLIADLKGKFTPAVLKSADKTQGRILFKTACASCHMLYGEGGKAGPDLTGSGRDNLDYLLENIVDPSAVVTADFRMIVVDLKDGRTLNGVVAERNDNTITLRTMAETVTLPRADIESEKPSSLSLMPEGLMDALTQMQARDLIAFLMDKESPR